MTRSLRRAYLPLNWYQIGITNHAQRKKAVMVAVVAAAITVELLAPAGERVARATGAVAVGAGLVLIAQAAGLG